MADCGHKKCKRLKRCHSLETHELYLQKREQGLPWYAAHSYTPASHLRAIMRDRVRDAIPARKLDARKRTARAHKKTIELYGGRTDQNLAARVKWLEAKANERTKSA